MEKLDYTFSIKKVKKTTDTDYIEAIKIYNEKIPYEIRTPSNEITMWINESQKKSPFALFCFILYFNNEVVGFSMETYIKRTKIMLGEYISLKTGFDFEITVFTFLDLMRNYYKSNNVDISYFIDEINYRNSGKSIDKESRKFKKSLCVQGYGEIDSIHTILPLGLNNFESSFDAKIYIKSNDKISEISKDTYLQIIESIYYDYYVAWYKILFSESDLNKYQLKVDTLFQDLTNKLMKTSKFKVLYTDCPILNDRKMQYDTISVPTKKHKSGYVWIIIVLLVIIVPPMAGYIYNWLLNIMEIEISSVEAIIGESISGILTFISTYIVYKKIL